MHTEDILIEAYTTTRDEYLDMLDDGIDTACEQQRAFELAQDMQDVDTLLSVYYSGGEVSDMMSEVSDRVAEMLTDYFQEYA